MSETPPSARTIPIRTLAASRTVRGTELQLLFL